VATEDDVRRLALALPETTEKPSYGTPGFRVKDRLFARIRGEHEGGLLLFVSDLGEKEAMLAADPVRFFTTPHYDGHPTVIARIEELDDDDLAELLAEAWWVRAPVAVRKRSGDAVRPA
jgi:hypothetical protein